MEQVLACSECSGNVISDHPQHHPCLHHTIIVITATIIITIATTIITITVPDNASTFLPLPL